MARAAEIAIEMYEGFAHDPVAASATYGDLKGRLGGAMPATPGNPSHALQQFIHDVEGGLVVAGGPRFFGWVIGGSHPAAIAADWVVSTWEQNGAIYACSPAAAVAEEIAGDWLKDVLGLPMESSFAMVTGCQMAHFTALAAARERLYGDRGIDVGRQGLFGAPPMRLIVGPHRHESLIRAMRFLGMGSDSLCEAELDGDGRLDLASLRRLLEEGGDAPTVVTLMAGDLNTAVADPFREACAIAHEHGAWVHVDGAFGLWMNASEKHRHVLHGVEDADSWATDGHKWMQLPFDNGFAFIRDRDAHRRSMTMTAGYFIAADGAGRDQMDWGPEWSRRPRGVVAYLTLKTLGREGIARFVDEGCRLADRLVTEIGALDGAEVLSSASMNQGLVRFLGADGDHDRRTDAVTDAIRAEGTAWFGATDWNGQRAMRISVCNFRTTDDDVDRTVEAVARVLASTP